MGTRFVEVCRSFKSFKNSVAPLARINTLYPKIKEHMGFPSPACELEMFKSDTFQVRDFLGRCELRNDKV